jgi:GTP cyclohydrolase II
LLLWGNLMSTNRESHIRLTSHPGHRTPGRYPLKWGAPTARERGPVIGTIAAAGDRNAIGAHGGSYALYRALAVSSGALNPIARPDLTNTSPVVDVGPFPQWGERERIVSLDPWGHRVAQDFGREIAEGLDIRPTIAITKARLTIPEFAAGANGVDWGVRADGEIVREGGDIAVTKAAIDPVWYLSGIAKRFEVSEDKLRHTLFEQTGGAYPELVTRPDLSVFLPPIGGMTLYMFGDPAAIPDRKRTLTCRVHDECNGSDVFGSDICTCRPYLIHGIAECVKEAQAGGAGLIVYNRQDGGDQAATYFERTECVAGVQDARFQQLMPDVLHWLGIARIDRFVSMSNMKYDAIVGSGIDIGERVSIPAGLVPPDAQVELEAKKAAGYFTPDQVPSDNELKAVVGRTLDEF